MEPLKHTSHLIFPTPEELSPEEAGAWIAGTGMDLLGFVLTVPSLARFIGEDFDLEEIDRFYLLGINLRFAIEAMGRAIASRRPVRFRIEPRAEDELYDQRTDTLRTMLRIAQKVEESRMETGVVPYLEHALAARIAEGGPTLQ